MSGMLIRLLLDILGDEYAQFCYSYIAQNKKKGAIHEK